MKIISPKGLIYFLILCIPIFLSYRKEQNPNDLLGKVVKIESMISSIKKQKDGSLLYYVAGFYFKESATTLVSFEAGDKIVVIGRAEERVISKKNKQFWLVNQSIIKNETDSKLENGGLLSIEGLFGRTRQKISDFFKTVLPEPQSSLFLGIVWGIKENLRSDLYLKLINAGLIHLVVASGQNLALFSKVVLDWLSFFVNRRLAILITFLLIIFYCFLVGLEPPIVRAGVMAGFSFLGLYLGREALAGVCLFISGYLMLVFNPSLINSVSFQLSFMATFGLVFLSPRFKKFKIFKAPILGQNFLETFSCQLATMPVLWFHFGILRPENLVPNLLVLWMIPILMSLGMIGFFVSLVFPFGGRFLCLLAWPLLTFFIRVAEIFGGL